MRQALKNMVSLGVPLHEALKMASLIPARAAGVDRERGSIEVVKSADLAIFDEKLDVALSVVSGEVLFRR
jgi:N-acetylglucosamine-6-phosphate deacetylase